jgi:hypothetical protein
MRFVTSQGYIRLTWKVAPCAYVCQYEHRIVMGNPPGVVHHKDGNRANNDPGNLEVIDSHRDHMRSHHGRSWSVSDAYELYLQGYSMRQLERRYSLSQGRISRVFSRHGLSVRPRSFWGPHDSRRTKCVQFA